jgi:ParB/RepB/Spo0J family partition protein
MSNDNQLAYIKTSNLRLSRIQLRNVDKRTVEYRELRDSIQAHGVWQPILVRPTETDGIFEVVDGFHRYNCCKELSLETIPCLVRDLTDNQVIVVQIQTTAVRLEAQPIEYARQLWRIIGEDRSLTIAELSRAVKKSPRWVSKMLHIRRLCNEAETAVDRGELSITIAHELAKLPEGMQRELLPQSIVMTVMDFLPIIQGIVRRFKTAIKAGNMKKYYRSLIDPVPHFRKMVELKTELKLPTAGSGLINKLKLKTSMEGWKACLEWVLHLDPDAIKAHAAKTVKCREQIERKAELRKQDRKNLRGKKL